jgi:hypothetical protein
VTISSQYQLETLGNKQLKIAFCRFEKVEKSELCINKVVEDIINYGVNREEIEAKLTKLGFQHGAASRKESFVKHDIFIFPVNESFPKITSSSFIDGRFPQGVEKISYQVNLSGLDYETF